MVSLSAALYDSSRRISKRVKSLRQKNPKRQPWKDRLDWVYGRYFFVTIPYGLYYLIGAFAGFGVTGNYFCLGISGGCGLVILILGIAHAVDYFRGVNIEAVYTALPFVISLFVAIFMTCLYGMGATIKAALPVAIVGWIAVVFYVYALMKDHGDGEYYRENVYVEPAMNPMQVKSSITDIHDLMHATPAERETFRRTVAHNLATSFNMPSLMEEMDDLPSDSIEMTTISNAASSSSHSALRQRREQTPQRLIQEDHA